MFLLVHNSVDYYSMVCKRSQANNGGSILIINFAGCCIARVKGMYVHRKQYGKLEAKGLSVWSALNNRYHSRNIILYV